jgi:hypothetical protein
MILKRPFIFLLLCIWVIEIFPQQNDIYKRKAEIRKGIEKDVKRENFSEHQISIQSKSAQKRMLKNQKRTKKLYAKKIKKNKKAKAKAKKRYKRKNTKDINLKLRIRFYQLFH